MLAALLAIDWEEVDFVGIAALLTALGGLVTTVIAHRQGKKEQQSKSEEDCYERLKAVREESEGLAQELHELRMKEFR
jgi:hypothetical protein